MMTLNVKNKVNLLGSLHRKWTLWTHWTDIPKFALFMHQMRNTLTSSEMIYTRVIYVLLIMCVHIYKKKQYFEDDTN